MEKRASHKGGREAALDILNRVFVGGAYADIVLEKEINRVKEEDRPLLTELVYGVLRWQIRLDLAIDAFSSIKTKKLEVKVLNALRIGAYQLLFLSGIPARAAVNETVNLVKAGGVGGVGGAKKAGFVNAVLREMDRSRDSVRYPDIKEDPVRHISLVYSHPEWMVRRWIERYGMEEALGLCQANQDIPPKTIRVNTLKTSRDKLVGELEREGCRAGKTRYSPHGIEIIEGGPLDPFDERFYIQDEASQLVSLLLCPKPGERVLDACAAPGGKTTHMASIMENKGGIYALDRHANRLKTLKDAAKRMGADIITALCADGTSGLPFKTGSFDAILVDAPCSGLGVLRRTPDIKIKRREEEIAGLSKVQSGLLNNLGGCLKRGGRLVYSVCTLEPEETDGAVRSFLRDNEGFVIEDAADYLPPSCRDLVGGDGFLRTFPHRHSLDGFFAARMRMG